MSEALDKRIDELRARLYRTANQQISMGNYKAMLRSYQEMMLELINIVDAVNEQDEDVSPGVVAKLKEALAAEMAKPDKPEGDK